MNLKNISLCIVVLLATASNIMSTKRYLRNKILENPVSKDYPFSTTKPNATTTVRKPSGMPSKSYIESTLHTSNNPTQSIHSQRSLNFVPNKTIIQPAQKFIRFNTSSLKINDHRLQAPPSFTIQPEKLQRAPQENGLFLPPQTKISYKNLKKVSRTKKIKPFENNTLENSKTNTHRFPNRPTYKQRIKFPQTQYKNSATFSQKPISHFDASPRAVRQTYYQV